MSLQSLFFHPHDYVHERIVWCLGCGMPTHSPRVSEWSASVGDEVCLVCCDCKEPGAVPCPECVAEKHHNCDGSSWDLDRDEPAPCPCYAGDPEGHERKERE